MMLVSMNWKALVPFPSLSGANTALQENADFLPGVKRAVSCNCAACVGMVIPFAKCNEPLSVDKYKPLGGDSVKKGQCDRPLARAN
jgi:hypothetical protein